MYVLFKQKHVLNSILRKKEKMCWIFFLHICRRWGTAVEVEVEVAEPTAWGQPRQEELQKNNNFYFLRNEN